VIYGQDGWHQDLLIYCKPRQADRQLDIKVFCLAWATITYENDIIDI